MKRIRPRLLTLFAVAALASGFVALGAMSLAGAVVYYRTPSELRASPSSDEVRLYGIVVTDSVDRASDGTLTFSVEDGTNAVRVSTRSIPTALFGPGIPVVLRGHLRGDVFEAADVLVKHSEVYGPLSPGETMPPGVLEATGT